MDAEAAARLQLVGSAIEALPVTSVEGASMDPAASRGRWVLVAFADRRARDEALAWFRTHAAAMAATPNLRVLNFVFPGHVTFLAPRGAVIRKLRREIDREMAEVRAGVPEPLRAGFEALEMGWHIDFGRRVAARFSAPRHRLALLLVDPEGIIRTYEDQVDEAAVTRILAIARAPARE